MILRCMTCQHIVIGDERLTVGCVCDPDAPTWVAIDRDQTIIGGTYRYYIPLHKAPSE